MRTTISSLCTSTASASHSSPSNRDSRRNDPTICGTGLGYSDDEAWAFLEIRLVNSSISFIRTSSSNVRPVGVRGDDARLARVGTSDMSPCARASVGGLLFRKKMLSSAPGRFLRVAFAGYTILGCQGCEGEDCGPLNRRGRLD